MRDDEDGFDLILIFAESTNNSWQEVFGQVALTRVKEIPLSACFYPIYYFSSLLCSIIRFDDFVKNANFWILSI